MKKKKSILYKLVQNLMLLPIIYIVRLGEPLSTQLLAENIKKTHLFQHMRTQWHKISTFTVAPTHSKDLMHFKVGHPISTAGNRCGYGIRGRIKKYLLNLNICSQAHLKPSVVKRGKAFENWLEMGRGDLTCGGALTDPIIFYTVHNSTKVTLCKINTIN